jgi:hypothetical protein
MGTLSMPRHRRQAERNPADTKTAKNHVNPRRHRRRPAGAQATTRPYGCSVKYSDG